MLELLRAGLVMGAVATQMGVTRQSLYNLAKRDEEMGARIRKAREEGRRQRQEHGTETCYVERNCRGPECVEAASAARATRRRRAAAAAAGARLSVYELADAVGPSPSARPVRGRLIPPDQSIPYRPPRRRL